MATWRLTGKHYLNVQIPDDPDNPIEWVYEETDTRSGRRIRKRYKVPLFMDPAEPSFYHINGQLYVAKEGKVPPFSQRDQNGTLQTALLFDGDPTPDMVPIDDEAEEISNACKSKWVAPMGEGAFPHTGGSYGDKLFQQLSEQLGALMSQQGSPKAASALAVSTITPEQFAELQAQLAEVMKSNQALQEQVVALASKPQPAQRRA